MARGLNFCGSGYYLGNETKGTDDCLNVPLLFLFNNKMCLFGTRPGQTHTMLLSHSSQLEA